MITLRNLQSKGLGFTLIELLVVATIIILLSTIGLISYSTASKNARNSKRKADLETVRQALVLYRSDNGTYPVQSGATPGDRYANALSTLVSGNYITSPYPNDPKIDTPYGYASGGTTFTLTATLETTPPSTWTVTNP